MVHTRFLKYISGYKPGPHGSQWQGRPLCGGEGGSTADGYKGSLHPKTAQSRVRRVSLIYTLSRLTHKNRKHLAVTLKYELYCSL